MSRSRAIRVLIVDDSAVIRQILANGLALDGEIEIAGTAADPFIARDKIVKDEPDVIVLDLQMPRMDGLTFLKKLMSVHPLPVIVFSSIAEEGSQVALEALELGALFVMPKPACDQTERVPELIAQLREYIKEAAVARLKPPRVSSLSTATGSSATNRAIGSSASNRAVGSGATTPAVGSVAARVPFSPMDRQRERKVIVMGASTGGTEALRTVLSALPPGGPGVLAVIHMPEGFTNKFAQRLNSFCAIPVREAADGDAVLPGQVLIARGDRHLALHRVGERYVAQVQNGPQICRHRPSVEVLFQSAARAAGPDALGAILTGMGADGAQGLLTMRDAGAYTIAQDEESCVVYGMPREAVQLHAAVDILPLNRIADACVRWFNSSKVQTLPRVGG